MASTCKARNTYYLSLCSRKEFAAPWSVLSRIWVHSVLDTSPEGGALHFSLYRWVGTTSEAWGHRAGKWGAGICTQAAHIITFLGEFIYS